MDTLTGQRLPIVEAAAVLGLSEKTIRRRIKVGALRADRVVTPQGHVWLVHVDGRRPDPPGQADSAVQVSLEDRQSAMLELTRSVASELTRSLSSRIEELVRENEQLQMRLQVVELRLALADTTPAVEATLEATAKRWWRRLFG